MTDQPSNPFESALGKIHRTSYENVFKPDIENCHIHGPYELNRLCDDGVIRYFAGGCQDCKREREVSKIMDRAAIPQRFKGCTFENYIAETEGQKLVLETCRQYAENLEENFNRGICMIFRGPPGTGKNHLATAITVRAMACGKTALHATAYELIQRLRQSWGDKSESEADVLRMIGSVDLLVIDEVGRQYKTDGEQIHMFQIIDYRYRKQLPMIVISNMSAVDVRQCLGEAAYDRLREGGGKVVNFDWQSYRGKAVKG